MTRIFTAATLAAASAFMLAPAVHAQSIEAGARISTLGAGAELGANIDPHWRVRGLVNGWNQDHDNTSDNIRYNGKIKLASAGVQLDYRPMENGSFYVTAGLYSNNNKVHETATPTQNTEIGSVTYTPAEIGTLTANGHFKRSAPYLGLGWDFPTAGPVQVNLEAGAYFQGHAHVSLTSNGTLAGNSAYQDQLEQERQSLQHDLDKGKTWPVVALGVRYQF